MSPDSSPPDARQLHPPMIMPPDLERWVRDRLGDEKFDWLRDRPLAAVALAAERGSRDGVELTEDLAHSWAKLIDAKRREIGQSQAALLEAVRDRGELSDAVRSRLRRTDS